MDRKAAMVTAGMAAALVTAALAGSSADQANPHVVQRTLSPWLHVSMAEIPWMTTNRHLDWFRNTYRYRELVGWISNWQDAGGAGWDYLARTSRANRRRKGDPSCGRRSRITGS